MCGWCPHLHHTCITPVCVPTDWTGAGVGALVTRGRVPVTDGDEVDLGSDSDGDVDPLRGVPKSERQKRKDKLRKAREKESIIDARKRKKDGDFEVGGSCDSGGCRPLFTAVL